MLKSENERKKIFEEDKSWVWKIEKRFSEKTELEFEKLKLPNNSFPVKIFRKIKKYVKIGLTQIC